MLQGGGAFSYERGTPVKQVATLRSLSLTHTHTHTISLSLTHTHTLSHLHTHTHSLSLSLSHTHAHTQVATLRGLATEPLVYAFRALEPQLQVHCRTIRKIPSVWFPALDLPCTPNAVLASRDRNLLSLSLASRLACCWNWGAVAHPPGTQGNARMN